MPCITASPMRTLLLVTYITAIVLLFASPALGKRPQGQSSAAPPSSRSSAKRVSSSSANDPPKPRKARSSYLQTKRAMTEESADFEDASPHGVTVPAKSRKAGESYLQTEKALKSTTKTEARVYDEDEDVDTGAVSKLACDSVLDGSAGTPRSKVGDLVLVSFSDRTPMEDIDQSIADPFVELEDIYDENRMGRQVENLVQIDGDEQHDRVGVVGQPEETPDHQNDAEPEKTYPMMSAILQIAACIIASKCVMTFYWQSEEELEQSDAEPCKADVRSNGATCAEVAIAIRDKDTKLVSSLLRNGADISAKDTWGCTALHIAASCGSLAAATVLMEYGARVNARDDWEETSLHIAARLGHIEICELLLAGGANVNAVDLDGRTPLLVAGQAGQEFTSDLLLAWNGGVGDVSEADLSPLLTAGIVGKIMERGA